MLGLYLAGLGFLAGILVERVRFDERRLAMLARADRMAREFQGHLVMFEGERIEARQR